MSVATLMKAVGDQRTAVLNIFGVIQCIKMAVRQQGKEIIEIEAAIELVEQSLQNVINQLEELARTTDTASNVRYG